KSLKDKLSKKSGTDFDKQYVSAMLDDHEKAVKDFTKEAKSSKDADLKAFADKTLPTLQEHLGMVKDLQSKMKGEKGAGTSAGGTAGARKMSPAGQAGATPSATKRPRSY